MNLDETLLKAPQGGVEQLLERVCDRFGISMAELLSRDRHSNIAAARAVAAWLLREHGLSFPVIGRVLRRDHSTVLVAVRKVEVDAAMFPKVAEVLQGLKGAA